MHGIGGLVGNSCHPPSGNLTGAGIASTILFHIPVHHGLNHRWGQDPARLPRVTLDTMLPL
jgi:hypothetical protein